MSKASRRELEAEIRLLRRARTSEGVYGVLDTFCKYGFIALVFYFIYMTFDAIAGKNTDASLMISVFGNLQVSIAVAWLVGVGGVWYGWTQRELRKTTIERLQSHIRLLEHRLDPQRSSSRLTPRGDSHPEDRP